VRQFVIIMGWTDIPSLGRPIPEIAIHVYAGISVRWDCLTQVGDSVALPQRGVLSAGGDYDSWLTKTLQSV
jgi:hypothetical protein